MTVAGARKAASAPEGRTVTAEGTGAFLGWQITARADFPARVLIDLRSGSIPTILQGLDAIVIDHNLPDGEGGIAASMVDVVPYEGAMHMAEAVFDAIGKLPNR